MTDPSTLVVVVPGLGRTRVESFVTRLATEHPEFRVELFEHRLSPLSTRRRLDDVVNSLAGAIRGWAGDNTGERDGTRSVILVGHSIGGILIRAAFLEALGYGASERDDQADGWWTKTDRIVLLGSPNAGYRVQNFPRSWRWAVPLLTGFASFTVESVAAGAFWLADLRLRWLEAMRALDADRNRSIRRPLLVQAYGDDDELVTRDDIDDSEYMPNTVRTGISQTDHAGLVDLTHPSSAEQRWRELDHAVVGPFEGADEHRAVSHEPVHFILHGIRSSAYETWIADLTSELRSEAHADPADSPPHAARVISLNYRFFSAIEFALPFTRRRNVHQFLDAYMGAVLTHSPDGFTFTGHSNGTYMMASVMRGVRGVRFHRILLAGTVLPPDFDWPTLYARSQIGRFSTDGAWSPGQVHTDRARIDVPVGILAASIRGLGFRDVGSAGVRGFEGPGALLTERHDRVFPPGHGAALVDHSGYPARMPEIARFLRTGTPCSEPREQPSAGFATASRIAQIVAPFAALAVLAALTFAVVSIAAGAGIWVALAVVGLPLLLAYIGLRTI